MLGYGTLVEETDLEHQPGHEDEEREWDEGHGSLLNCTRLA